jgi:hypothetical protein
MGNHRVAPTKNEGDPWVRPYEMHAAFCSLLFLAPIAAGKAGRRGVFRGIAGRVMSIVRQCSISRTIQRCPARAGQTCDHAPPVRRPAASAGAKAGAGPFAPLLGQQKWNLVLSRTCADAAVRGKGKMRSGRPPSSFLSVTESRKPTWAPARRRPG